MSNDITYAKVEDGVVVKWPVRSTDVAEWRLKEPKLRNISLPKGVPGPNIMKMFGCFPVIDSPIPDHDPTQFTVVEIWPKVSDNNTVVKVWAVVPLPDAVIREQHKLIKDALVSKIVVQASTGKSFNGNEVSQHRMTTAVLTMRLTGEFERKWVLSDNTEAFVSLDELCEALVLANKEQSRIWTSMSV